MSNFESAGAKAKIESSLKLNHYMQIYLAQFGETHRILRKKKNLSQTLTPSHAHTHMSKNTHTNSERGTTFLFFNWPKSVDRCVGWKFDDHVCVCDRDCVCVSVCVCVCDVG